MHSIRGGLHLGFRASGLSLNPKGARGLYSRFKVKYNIYIYIYIYVYICIKSSQVEDLGFRIYHFYNIYVYTCVNKCMGSGFRYCGSYWYLCQP